MNLPSGKLMALLAVFAAIGVITGTGAFTTVSAERTATVNVAGDSSALLSLAPAPTENGNGLSGSNTSSDGYARLNGGQLEIKLDGFGSSSSGAGVNMDAITTIDQVFVITNQGSQPVYVHIEPNVTAGGAVVFYNGTDYNSDQNITSEDNTEKLTVGESTRISIKIDTLNTGDFSKNEALLNGMKVVANATDPSS